MKVYTVGKGFLVSTVVGIDAGLKREKGKKKEVTSGILCTMFVSAFQRFCLKNVLFILISGKVTMTDEREGCSEQEIC